MITTWLLLLHRCVTIVWPYLRGHSFIPDVKYRISSKISPDLEINFASYWCGANSNL